MADSTPTLAGCVGLTGKKPSDPGQRPGNTWKRKALVFGEVLLIQTGWALQPTPVCLPGESQGQRSLEGYSPQGGTELDRIEVT